MRVADFDGGAGDAAGLASMLVHRPAEPLSAQTSDFDADEVYGINEASAGCVICHK